MQYTNVTYMDKIRDMPYIEYLLLDRVFQARIIITLIIYILIPMLLLNFLESVSTGVIISALFFYIIILPVIFMIKMIFGISYKNKHKNIIQTLDELSSLKKESYENNDKLSELINSDRDIS